MGIVIYAFHNLSIITVCVVSSRDVTPFSDSVVFGVWVGNVHTYSFGLPDMDGNLMRIVLQTVSILCTVLELRPGNSKKCPLYMFKKTAN